MAIKNKRGFYFSLDAFLALAAIVAGVLLIPQLYTQYHESTSITYISKDLTELMATTTVGEINNSYIQSLIISTDIDDSSLTIAEQVSKFWIEGKQTEATNIIENITAGIVPQNVEFSVVIGNNTVYTTGGTPTKSLITTNQMITGMEVGKALEGSAVRIFLTGISGKTTSNFIYFGGFVGQGTITKFMEDIPSDADIVEMQIELDAGNDFELLVNNQSCNNFTVTGGFMAADNWDITNCSNLIEKGIDVENNFTLDFHSADVSASYIGGGFIEVRYRTNITQEDEDYGIEKYMFPEIDGMINLYSSVSVPGTLEEMKIRLHLESNQTMLNNTHPVYLLIGNKIVYYKNQSYINEDITINNTNLSSILNYNSLSNTTIPIRLGVENMTYETEFVGVADVSLITDLSGSMGWRMDQNSVAGTLRNCNDTNLSDPDTERLSIAKCLDRQFTQDILNVSGNEIGLIAFASSTITSRTVNLTTNTSLLNATIGTAIPLTGYVAGGGTCICCGINSAKDQLIAGLSEVQLINTSEEWKYNNFTLDGNILPDASGNEWYETGYSNESSWHNGTAILGATNGDSYSPAVVTEIGSGLTGSTIYTELWENTGDTSGAPNDFSSGTLNSTANTFGLESGDDGWDWETATYGNDGNLITMDGLQNRAGDEELRIFAGGVSATSSGSYGIEVNITQSQYDTISSGSARLSFDYEWDGADNPFEDNDQVWIKARITTPSNTTSYLGTDQDTSHNNGDADPEIDTRENPNNEFFGRANIDLTSFITQPGMYYIDFGGKLRRSAANENGYFYFDDIQIEITNKTDYYYFRKNFNINNINDVRRGMLNIISDGRVAVYINGNKILEESTEEIGEYWNVRGFDVDEINFVSGNNLIAVQLWNSNGAAKFDLELKGFDEPKAKAMMVMTDGEATQTGSCPQSGTAKERAIQAACEAKEQYGISVHAVGYSTYADAATLGEIADCGGGIYTTSSNVTELEAFYEDVAAQIIEISRRSQQIITAGAFTNSYLHGDSYIKIDYTPNYNESSYAEVPITLHTPQFGTCYPQVDLSPDLRIIEAQVLSYSSEHWTDLLEVNNWKMFDLSTYNLDYTPLGDPFVVEVMPNRLVSGTNNLTILTGDNVSKKSNCSDDNSMTYTGMISSALTFDSVKELRNGCEWYVETESGSFLNISAPTSYSGFNDCNYTSSDISYNTADAYDTMMYQLLDRLDLDDNGKIEIELDEENLNIDTLLVENIPYMWGPTTFEVRTWH